MSEGAGVGLCFHVVPFERLDGTNAEARRQISAGAEPGTVIWARRQEAGRGRRGRVWVSDLGNLFCSVVVRPECSLAEASQLSLVTALAVAEMVEKLLAGAVPVQVKWPNDVLVRGRKLAGILLECESGGESQAPTLIVGVGLNIAHAPEDTEFPATALTREGAAGLAVEAVLQHFLEQFASWYRRWCREGVSPVRAAWLARAAGLGGRITVRLQGETLSGSFIGLDEGGALLLNLTEGGPARRITAGDVFFPVTPC